MGPLFPKIWIGKHMGSTVRRVRGAGPASGRTTGETLASGPPTALHGTHLVGAESEGQAMAEGTGGQDRLISLAGMIYVAVNTGTDGQIQEIRLSVAKHNGLTVVLDREASELLIKSLGKHHLRKP